ncbi:MAG: hypothetical protein EA349_09490 [Halomonadaceae bacterium]|nr:MAG: hypothetical protein EA349_09490 [Halomonadaceae bacterium]
MKSLRDSGASGMSRWLSVLLCLLISMAWVGSSGAQEPMEEVVSDEVFSGMVNDVDPGERLITVEGRQFNLAPSLKLNGQLLRADQALTQLGPQMGVTLYLERRGSSVVIGIGTSQL